MTQNAFAVANSVLKGIGLKLSEAGERNAIELLNTLMVAESGRIRLPVQIRDEGGDIPAAEYLARLTKQNPAYFKSIDSPKPSNAPPVAENMLSGLTAAMVAANAGKRASRQAALGAKLPLNRLAAHLAQTANSDAQRAEYKVVLLRQFS